jgi:hypothetical protein
MWGDERGGKGKRKRQNEVDEEECRYVPRTYSFKALASKRLSMICVSP